MPLAYKKTNDFLKKKRPTPLIFIVSNNLNRDFFVFTRSRSLDNCPHRLRNTPLFANDFAHIIRKLHAAHKILSYAILFFINDNSFRMIN
jgi:hypothetical protein